MNSDLIFLGIDFATIVILLLIALRVVTVAPSRRESWLIAFLSVASIFHVALSRAEYGYWIAEPYRFAFGAAEPVFNVVRNLTPGLFALLTSMLFVDRRDQPLWMYALLLVQIALEVLRVVGVEWADAPSAWLQVVFAAAAIYWTIGYWRADLIESRRRIRALVILILAVNVVAPTILLRLIIAEDSIANYHGYTALSVMTLATVTFLLFRLMDGDIGVAAIHVPSNPGHETANEVEVRSDRTRQSEDELALKRLNALLLEQCVYRESGLSLKALADRVGLPEYRLRKLIHESLGFRNFNSLLHAYRVREAARQLSNAEYKDKAIVAIAHSVGYESVNTFNRGFKEIMGATPTEYRARGGDTLSITPNS